MYEGLTKDAVSIHVYVIRTCYNGFKYDGRLKYSLKQPVVRGETARMTEELIYCP